MAISIGVFWRWLNRLSTRGASTATLTLWQSKGPSISPLDERTSIGISAVPLALSHTAIGLFGLAGVAGALAARRAGRWADQGLGQRVTGISLGLLTLSWLPISSTETSLIALVVGVVLLDFAVQAVHVTNQSLILAARRDAQSRRVGAYMCFYSIGSALGALISTAALAVWAFMANRGG